MTGLSLQVSLDYLSPCSRAIWHRWYIAGMDHTNTKWWVRLKQGRSHNRVLRNRVRHSREQSLKPLQATRAQGRDQERLRLPRSNLRHVTFLRIHSLLLCDSSQQRTVQQTTPAKLLQ
jgi:hypothetical protein